jgi:hypothetical protein
LVLVIVMVTLTLVLIVALTLVVGDCVDQHAGLRIHESTRVTYTASGAAPRRIS